MELSLDVGHRPIIFIRFNPDDYKNFNGTNITSCWGINRMGICTVKKAKVKEWNDRLKALSEKVKYWIEPKNVSEKIIEVVQLFYDKV